MPVVDITTATCIATGISTATMALVANFPWVVSTQLGTVRAQRRDLNLRGAAPIFLTRPAF
jgi:hypothetical protein